MKKISFKHLLLFSASGLALTLPSAFLVACGPEDTLVTTNELNALVGELRVKASSTHDHLTWTEATPSVSIQKLVFFASDNPTSETEVTRLSESEWSDALPDTTTFDYAKRSLWAKAIPAAGYRLEKAIFNITASSGLVSVKSRLNVVPGYDDTLPAKVQLLVSNSGAIGQNDLYEMSDVPKGLVLKYDTAEKTGLSASDLRAYLNAAPRSIMELQAITCYLAPADPTHFIVESKPKKPILNYNKFTLAKLPSQDVNKLTELKAQGADSLHLTWTPLPQPSSAVQQFLFLSGNYLTKDAVKNVPEKEWRQFLPDEVDYNHAARHLWAKVVLSSKYALSDPLNDYVDLTDSSGIKAIKTIVDSFPNYAYLDLSQISVLVKALTVQVSEFNALPIGAKLLFDTKGEKGIDLARLKTYLAASYRLEDAGTVFAYLAPTDNLKYVIKNDLRKPLSINLVTRTIAEPSVADKSAVSALTVQPATINELKVVWNKLGLLSPDIASVSYLSGNYKLLGDVVGASSWASSLPTALAFDFRDRHLWVRFNPVNGLDIKNPYFEITGTSQIRAVKSQVDLHDNYASIDLNSRTPVGVHGNQYVFEVYESAITPGLFNTNVLSLKYTFKNQVYDSYYLKFAVQNVGEALTLKDVTDITVEFVVKDPEHYFLSDTKKAPIKIDLGPANKWFAIAKLETNPLAEFVSITYSGPNNYDATLSIIPSTVTGRYIPRFLVGNYPSVDAVVKNLDKAITSNFPTVLDPVHANRYVWLIIDELSGHHFEESIQNITEFSQVRQVKTAVDRDPKYNPALDLSTIWTHGGIANPLLPFNSVTLPTGLKVVYTLSVTGSDEPVQMVEASQVDIVYKTYLQVHNIETLAQWKAAKLVLRATLVVTNARLYVFDGAISAEFSG